MWESWNVRLGMPAGIIPEGSRRTTVRDSHLIMAGNRYLEFCCNETLEIS